MQVGVLGLAEQRSGLTALNTPKRVYATRLPSAKVHTDLKHLRSCQQLRDSSSENTLCCWAASSARRCCTRQTRRCCTRTSRVRRSAAGVVEYTGISTGSGIACAEVSSGASSASLTLTPQPVCAFKRCGANAA